VTGTRLVDTQCRPLRSGSWSGADHVPRWPGIEPFIRGRLVESIEHAHTPIRLVVIEASGVTDIDYTGANVMVGMLGRLRERGIQIALARLSSERAQEHADRTGLLMAFGEGQAVRSVEEALQAFKERRAQCLPGGGLQVAHDLPSQTETAPSRERRGSCMGCFCAAV